MQWKVIRMGWLCCILGDVFVLFLAVLTLLLPDLQAVPQVEMRKVSADGGGSWGSNGPADTRGGSARGGGGGGGEGNSLRVR